MPARRKPPPRSPSHTFWMAFCIVIGVAYVVIVTWAVIALISRIVH